MTSFLRGLSVIGSLWRSPKMLSPKEHSIPAPFSLLSFSFSFFLSFFFKKDFIYLFSERGQRREIERERHIERLPLTCPQLAHNPGTCPDQESNRRPFDLQAGAQSTEPSSAFQHNFFVDDMPSGQVKAKGCFYDHLLHSCCITC